MSGTGNSPPRLAGGIFIALGLLGGAIAGGVIGQTSAGMIIGLAAGAAIAVLVWLYDRKRG